MQERRPSQLCRLLRHQDIGQVPDELLQGRAVRGHVRRELLRGLQLQQLSLARGNAAGQRRLHPVRGKRPLQEILQSLFINQIPNKAQGLAFNRLALSRSIDWTADR